MPNERADLLLHPIRLRIVMAMAGDELTTAELAQRLTDVPQATLYRQVAVLHDAGILEVVAETQNRGGVERTYRLVENAASLGPEDATQMTAEEHMAGLTTFVGAVVEATARYLHSEGARPGADVFGYRQIPLWLSDQEAREMIESLGRVIQPFLDNQPEGRSRVLLNTILIPDGSAGR